MHSEGNHNEQQSEAAPHESHTPSPEGDAAITRQPEPDAEVRSAPPSEASSTQEPSRDTENQAAESSDQTAPEGAVPVGAAPSGGPPPPEETAGDSTGEAAPAEDQTARESSLPAWARARKTAEAAPARRGWNPLLVVGLLLLVVVGALFAADRLQGASGSSSSSTTATTPPTSPPIPTPSPIPTPVVKGGAVAAIVDGHSIPTSRYRVLLNFAVAQSAGRPGVKVSSLARLALNQVIRDQIISDYASAHNIRLSSSELNTRIQQIKTQQGGEKGFQRWLTSVHLNFASFKSLLIPSMLQEKVAQQVAPVAAAHVRHILVFVHPPGQKAVRSDAAGHARAQQILSELQHGASFAALARKNSDDPGSKLKGGDLGTIYPHSTVPTFDRAAFSLPLNHPAIVHSEFGYHIIEVLSRLQKAPLPKDQTGQQAYQQAQQAAFTPWINSQVKKASIKRIATVQG